MFLGRIEPARAFRTDPLAFQNYPRRTAEENEMTMLLWDDIPQRTTETKKCEYARKFPWMAQFAPDGTFGTLGLIKVEPPLSVKGWMHERLMSDRFLYLVGEDGTILCKVGYRKNAKPKNWLQRNFPKQNPYDEEVHFEETLAEAMVPYVNPYGRYVGYVVYVEYNPLSRPDTTLLLYKVPREYASFAAYFEQVRQEEEQEGLVAEEAARVEVEAELRQ